MVFIGRKRVCGSQIWDINLLSHLEASHAHMVRCCRGDGRFPSPVA